MKKKNLLMTAIAIFGLTTITSAQVPTYVPTNGLVGWWPFNGTVFDAPWDGNNGSVNGATLTTDRFGNANKAYGFDGVDDNIHVGQINVTSDYSVSFWIFLNNSNFQYPIGFGINQFNTVDIYKGYGFGYSSTVPPCTGLGSSKYFVYDAVSTCNTWIECNSQSSPNQWNHIVIQKNGNLVSLYIDGVIDNSGNNLNLQGIIDLYFGVRSDLFAYFDGTLDDIGIWNRAITQQEITDLYNGCQLSVSAQPTNQTININNNAQFVVSSSDPGATYQWQTDLGVGFQNLNSVGQYSGTTNDTLTVSNVTMTNNNQPFRCIISSGSCSDTSNVAVLTVNNNVGINETIKENLFSVFPNPAQSVINVKADSKLIGSVYSIYDNTGRVVLSGKLNDENAIIEFGDLSGGIYMFSVGENMKQTLTVIKQ